MTVSHNAPAYLPTSWTLEFDGHPPSRNDRLHWRTAHKWAKHWKQLVMLKCRETHVARCQRVRVSLVVLRPRLGVADPDNDACRTKHLIDGLVAAGVVPDDTYAHVELGPVSEERGAKGVRLIVEMLR